ncbi:MAG TPA: redoxin family protein [Pirellulales bacterium]|jgi:thiol-disulfide isomerase/thioredoxin|nr:redoxin family protein [Pirellulales bacterium]
MKAGHRTCVLLVGIAVAGARADDQKPKDVASAPSKPDERLREIIERVRQAEDRYTNLETTVRIGAQDESKPADPQSRLNVAKNEETRYTLEQGDRFLFKRRDVQTLISGEQVVSEQTAAFDGETTRSIVYGNCANVYAGRHEPSQLYPPHTWGMYPLWVNFPLSVYLQGTEAIQKHAKSFKSPAAGGRVFEIAKAEPTVEGDDAIDGLPCIKLRCRRWYRETDQPVTEELWLVPGRNYLCAKAVTYAGEGNRAVVHNESVVTEWAEPAPGLWLPKRVEMRFFNRPGPGNAREVRRRETLTLEKATVNPAYPADRFSLKLPPDLPVYRIDHDGFVEGSGVRSAKTAAADRNEVDRIVAEVRRQEERLERFDVRLTTSYRTFAARNIGMPGLHLSSDETERTISLPGKLYSEREQKWHTVARGDSQSAEKGGWDGQWIRSLHWHTDQANASPTPDWATVKPNWVSLRKGGPNGLGAFRPHTALFDDWRMRSRPLSDFLTAEYWDETDKYRYLVEYLGEETVDGLRCERLRLGFMYGTQTQPALQFFFLWLATDRNYLPVRSEHVDLAWSERLPRGVAYADDLREVAPGLWFPFHVVVIGHDNWGRDGAGSGQIVVHWRRDRQIETVKLDPEAPEELFSPAVAAGATVSVGDASGHPIGQFRQKEDGVPQVDDEKFRTMAETARVEQEEYSRRKAAMDALIGAPLPEIPEATWLNSAPLSRQSLAGKVLLLDFWAEWCGPCRGDLENLAKIDEELAAAGVTLIGVHTAGSDRSDVENLDHELGLDYPILIDAANPDGTHRWGKLFERFAVREIPHAFVVDRQGKIVAHGRLDQMIPRASALAAQK